MRVRARVGVCLVLRPAGRVLGRPDKGFGVVVEIGSGSIAMRLLAKPKALSHQSDERHGWMK